MAPTLQALKPVPEGATIRMIAPSNFVTESDVVSGMRVLKKQKFKLQPCPHLFDRDGQFGGSDKVRAQSLMDAFTDPEVDVIHCARGGYGAPRILDLVDWGLVAKHPKPFIGYSDATVILNALVFDCAMPAFHGPMVRDLKEGEDEDDRTTRGFLEALRGSYGDWPTLCKEVKVLREGSVTAAIVGGNITMLATLSGTGGTFSADGAILLLEDVEEYTYRLDRALVQLSRAGMLKGVKGVIISDLTEVEDGNVPFGKTPEQMILSHFPDVPVIANFPAGHGPRKATLPLGVAVTLEAGKGGASISLAQ